MINLLGGAAGVSFASKLFRTHKHHRQAKKIAKMQIECQKESENLMHQREMAKIKLYEKELELQSRQIQLDLEKEMRLRHQHQHNQSLDGNDNDNNDGSGANYDGYGFGSRRAASGSDVSYWMPVPGREPGSHDGHSDLPSTLALIPEGAYLI